MHHIELHPGDRGLWKTLALNRAQAVYLLLLIGRERAREDPETVAMLNDELRTARSQVEVGPLGDYLLAAIAEADEYGSWELLR